MGSSPKPKKIAVLGGGPSALAAAFVLSDGQLEPPPEVTVYQLGWRLGGKGASGRNSERHARIQEHGLHLWFGFYEKAFNLMREVYEVLGTDAPAPWHEAFSPVKTLVFKQPDPDGAPRSYSLPAPHAKLEDRWPEPVSPVDYGRAVASWLLAVWRAQQTRALALGSEPPTPLTDAAGAPPETIFGADALRWAARLLDAAATEIYHREDQARREPRSPGSWPKGVDDPDVLRLLGQLCDFWGATLDRLLDQRVLCGDPLKLDPDALERLNDVNFRDWLTVRDRTRDAPFVRALHDLVFAYKGGDRDVPCLAAGVAIGIFFRICFDHRGSLMLRMEGGMGDVIFAPLYQALIKRKVKFRFFHAITGLHQTGGEIDRIDVVEQVRLKPGRAIYEPLAGYTHKGSRPIQVWPSEPRWDQVAKEDCERVAGHDLEREHNPLNRKPHPLELGCDFDAVVLGIPVKALDPICSELPTDSPMRRAIASACVVSTQALQLWLTKPAPDVGLAPHAGAVSGGDHPPFDTYADMSHVVSREDWDPSLGVQIAYFCGVLADAAGDHKDPRRRQEHAESVVATSSQEFLDRPGHEKLRAALANRDGRPGGTLADQYKRANVAPGERYTLSPPRTIDKRLAPGGSGFANLAVAGDWTKTAINAGCVEAAVESGELAAQAIMKWAASP